MKRRDFLHQAGRWFLLASFALLSRLIKIFSYKKGIFSYSSLAALGWFSSAGAVTDKNSGIFIKEREVASRFKPSNSQARRSIRLFLSGDVMTGRGIDQIMPYSVKPQIYEPYSRTARDYIALAERKNGRFRKPIDHAYIWGDALAALEQMSPDIRAINLETSVTTSNRYWQGKGIHYRMHPQNIACLKAAKIDICALANNHVLDWGYSGLLETIDGLRHAEIKIAGAGYNLMQARAPAKFNLTGKSRLLFYSLAEQGSGTPYVWKAARDKPGVNLLPDLSEKTLNKLARQYRAVRKQGDILVVSIHWGGNWGYKIPRQHSDFSHGLIDRAGVDIVHGHSSHHPKGIEVYNNKVIIYGCGDLLNDYEGIRGHESYRGDLGLMYFVDINIVNGELLRLELLPTQIKHFKVNYANMSDAIWLKNMLNREGEKLGTQVTFTARNSLVMNWH